MIRKIGSSASSLGQNLYQKKALRIARPFTENSQSKITRRGKSTCQPVKNFSDVMSDDYEKIIEKNCSLLVQAGASANIHVLG